MPFFKHESPVGWARDEKGVLVFFSDEKAYDRARHGSAKDISLIRAAAVIDGLLEMGEASTAGTAGRIFLEKEDVVRLSPEDRETLNLPAPWHGGFQAECRSVPNLEDFGISLRLLDEYGHTEPLRDYKGGVFKVHGNEFFLASAPQFAAIEAFFNWKKQPEKTEVDHLVLISSLQEAARGGCRINLTQLGDFTANVSDEVVIRYEEQADGALMLTPLIRGGFEKDLAKHLIPPGSDASDEAIENAYAKAIKARLHQLDTEAERGILRIGETIVVLDAATTKSAAAVAGQPLVPSEEKDVFLRDPNKWLGDHQFRDVDIEFLPRVVGIGQWKPGYVGASGELGEPIDWFDLKPTPEAADLPEDDEPLPTPDTPEVTKLADDDLNDSDSAIDIQDDDFGEGSGSGSRKIDTPPGEERPLVPLIQPNDNTLTWGVPGMPNDPLEVPKEMALGFDDYPRKPFKHQQEAISWLAQHTTRGGQPSPWSSSDHSWGCGALLADDMGLGKTMSTLLFTGKWMEVIQKLQGNPSAAVLVIAPLSLVENWAAEIDLSFPKGAAPFGRVVIGIPGADLKSFYRTPNGRDVMGDGEEGEAKVERFGLRFGDGTEASLDQPGTCVITTYQTLRDFRFSFAGCRWSCAIFDEAQNIKNPNAMQTVAAKALAAYFRVALTGTPVENNLTDLWSIMDCVEPGFLGAFGEFKTRWITPHRGDPDYAGKTGSALRRHLGNLVLRRTKKDSVDLPPKEIKSVSIPMTEQQRPLYEAVLDVMNSKDEDEEAVAKQWLSAIWELRRISLHPALIGDASPASPVSEETSRRLFAESGKLNWLLGMLDSVKAKGEKVLLFAVQKKFQQLLSSHLEVIYGIKVPVINGDTKATRRTSSNTRAGNATRLELIRDFSNSSGFGVCVLSPIAAGAGLNITAANHVVHLERHWNPAKEDQATDRAYRIGQEKAVTVYLPLLKNDDETIKTFDACLDELIERKRTLIGSVGFGFAPITSVKLDDIVNDVMSKGEHKNQSLPLEFDRALDLSWTLFESLVAEIYSRESSECYLTPGGSDSGADVVVLGYGQNDENVLIQCKTSTAKHLTASAAFREVFAAKPVYESKMSRSFTKLLVHSNCFKISKESKKVAKATAVDHLGASWLAKKLKEHPIVFADLIRRDSMRKRF